MRRQRVRTAVVAGLLLGAAGCVSALAADDVLTEVADSEVFKLAKAFDGISDDNATELLDDVVAPASLKSEKAVTTPGESEPRDLRPIEVSTSEHSTGDFPTGLPYGGALVAVETTALLVGGATVVALVIAKVKARSTADQYDYNYDEADYVDPMLQSLLYSDMDYAAI